MKWFSLWMGLVCTWTAAALAADDDATRRQALQGRLTQEDQAAQRERIVAELYRLRPSTPPPPAPKFPFAAEAARAYQEAYAAWSGLPRSFRNAAGHEMTLVPPGTFLIGSPATEPGHGLSGYEEKQGHVELTRPFYLAAHETRQDQFAAFVSQNAYVTDVERTGGGNAHDGRAVWKHRPGTQWRRPGFAGGYQRQPAHPAVHVSHTDALRYCLWLNQQAGFAAGASYDLPAEAEWEWACRGGAGGRYWWGEELDDTGKRLNVCDASLKRAQPEWPREPMPMDDGHAFLAPVGSYAPNPFGLYDMLGNVWEFCGTRFGPYPQEPTRDPGDLSSGRGFAVRGGGWSNVAADVRCGSRNADPPHFGHSNLGFRAALRFDASPPRPPARVPILLDTDIGTDIDDAFAVALAVASPEIELLGVTTVGGDTRTRAAIASRFLCNIGGEAIPTAAGAYAGKPQTIGQFQYGLRPGYRGEQPLPAVEFLYQRLRARPGEITLVAVGELTNVAALLAAHPDCKPWIKRLVLMGGAVRIGYNLKPPAEPEWNIKSDVKAAQAVFASGLPIVVAPLDATAMLKFDADRRGKLFAHRTPTTNHLRALYELWAGETPILYDCVAVALAVDDAHCRLEPLRLEIADNGLTRAVEGEANCRVALAIDAEAFLNEHLRRLTANPPGEPRPLPRTNLAQPVAAGPMPREVHVVEDYETDIERRWWLAGTPETKHLPPGSARACRGALVRDFDDRQGDRLALYRAVIFNPVPGPPMGPKTRLRFRYLLRGGDALRVQIYSLSNGYHRHQTLTGLPQGAWQDCTVDMTLCRRPDGGGGPLSTDERIDDIQFYADPDAELLIDDVILYDAGSDDERRPFPRPLFSGWFDTGKQGQEWPGEFAIVPHQAPRGGAPRGWKAAQAIKSTDGAAVRALISLRGSRPLGSGLRLRVSCQAAGTQEVRVRLFHQGQPVGGELILPAGAKGDWIEHDLAWPGLTDRERAADVRADAIEFRAPPTATLLLDDLLLYLPKFGD